jgi:uncharacterized protein YbjT (DUF2867 family)
MDNKIIAVSGATGQQGGVVARKLFADGWKVRALTRDVDKAAAQELASLGAEVVAGDMDNRAELDAAFKGVYGVFSVQNFWLPNIGFEGEIRQGKNVAEAAKDAGRGSAPCVFVRRRGASRHGTKALREQMDHRAIYSLA